jgi:PPOX class probable F420-dependent enzyme
MPEFDALASARYVSLATRRKDGSLARAPIWIAALDGRLVFYTSEQSFKARRIAADGRVRVAPCDARGKLRGDDVDGFARKIADPARAAAALEAIRRKYGWQLAMIRLAHRFLRRGETHGSYEIELG